MQFKLTAVVALLAAATPVVSTKCADDLVKTLNSLFEEAEKTSKAVDAIKLVNIFTDVPQTVTPLSGQIRTVGDAHGSGDCPGLRTEDQKKVCDALETYVKSNEDLTKAITDKADLLKNIPFTAPIGAVLRTYEGVFDTYANKAINAAPTCSDATKLLKSLGDNLTKAIDSYA
ncbi:hypothetical protein ASPWEDRAFT_429248 [Aspergillus wentii DTO 134E9]|uniref:Pectinesterase inhibitor domain-containing protein n=1 Tax=Aspergillus wentii DTO 134E9 TaxID=1073089 RepID=A0A1L9RPG3_ASPWE|nr:uncharacterized protein ASPWEDRAFT_429248 [Aspergillus wentii DTO 134E9]KAI9924140.1 hypothetical protein MW887_007380 [Aspergillus wentii]OJJ36814.1 hypothetical protein ASPWEDRAFT_429248 [Aspergillus wentii DTO 134E9]